MYVSSLHMFFSWYKTMSPKALNSSAARNACTEAQDVAGMHERRAGDQKNSNAVCNSVENYLEHIMGVYGSWQSLPRPWLIHRGHVATFFINQSIDIASMHSSLVKPLPVFEVLSQLHLHQPRWPGRVSVEYAPISPPEQCEMEQNVLEDIVWII